MADLSSWEILLPPRGLLLFLGDNTICFPLLFGVPAILMLLPLALTDFVAACFAACNRPCLGLCFWGSSSLPSHAGLLLDTLGIVLSKLNAFDRRRDEFDCSETEELDQIQCKVGKSE